LGRGSGAEGADAEGEKKTSQRFRERGCRRTGFFGVASYCRVSGHWPVKAGQQRGKKAPNAKRRVTGHEVAEKMKQKGDKNSLKEKNYSKKALIGRIRTRKGVLWGGGFPGNK